MRKLFAWLAALAVMTTTALVTPAAAHAGTFCEIRWGSLDRGVSGIPGGPSPLTNVRAGQHPCYDRLVLDFQGAGASAARVRYVPAVPHQAKSEPLSLRGGAFLEILLLTTSYDINTGTSTYSPANGQELVNVNGWRTFRQVADGGSFEGVTTIGLGVRARLPFRLFALAGPGGHSRLVIDVAHRWYSTRSGLDAHELPAPTSTALQYSALGDNSNATFVGVRAGAHPTYDRVVFDFRGPNTGLRYVVGYDGSWLRIDLEHGVRSPSAAYNGPWFPALAQLKTIRIVNVSTDGTTVLLTLGHTAGFRAFMLGSPDRIVVDIAH